MVEIDLHKFYSNLPKGSVIEVTEEVLAALMELKREEIARQVKEYRHKAYYSLDMLDGIEEEYLRLLETPQEKLENEYDKLLLHKAISQLPKKQARRVYSRFFLGMNFSEIAKLEGVRHPSIIENIDVALAGIVKYFKKNSF